MAEAKITGLEKIIDNLGTNIKEEMRSVGNHLETLRAEIRSDFNGVKIQVSNLATENKIMNNTLRYHSDEIKATKEELNKINMCLSNHIIAQDTAKLTKDGMFQKKKT